MDFDTARQTVQRELDRLYAGERENPTAQPYGFDTGTAWAPVIRWDGVMGVYIYLVDKTTGALKPLSFPDFEALPAPKRVGRWPR